MQVLLPNLIRAVMDQRGRLTPSYYDMTLANHTLLRPQVTLHLLRDLCDHCLWYNHA